MHGSKQNLCQRLLHRCALFSSCWDLWEGTIGWELAGTPPPTPSLLCGTLKLSKVLAHGVHRNWIAEKFPGAPTKRQFLFPNSGDRWRVGGALGRCLRERYSVPDLCSNSKIILKKVFKCAVPDTLFSPSRVDRTCLRFWGGCRHTRPPDLSHRKRRGRPGRPPALALRCHLRAAAPRIKKETDVCAEFAGSLRREDAQYARCLEVLWCCHPVWGLSGWKCILSWKTPWSKYYHEIQLFPRRPVHILEAFTADS